MYIGIGIKKNHLIHNSKIYAAFQRRRRIIALYSWKCFLDNISKNIPAFCHTRKTRTLANFINMIYWMQTACSPRLSITSRIHSLYTNTRIGERISAYAQRTCSCCDFGRNYSEVSNRQLALTKAFKFLQQKDLFRNF